MPSAIGHAVFAISLSPFRPYNGKLLPTLLLAMFCASMPDLDVIGFEMGIRYGSILGHRGFSHSILFAGFTGLLISYIFFNELCKTRIDRLHISGYYFLITLSHGLLDALTDGGLGVGFFIPFYNERYFFPIRIIPVSSLYIEAFFTPTGFSILIQEMKFIGTISFFVLIAGYFWRNYFYNSKT